MNTSSAAKGLWNRQWIVRLSAVLVLYLLIAVVCIGANPFRGETTGPFDLLASYPGWSAEGAPVEVRNGERSDVLDALLPDWLEARGQIRDGVIPLWNPLPAGGHSAILDPTRAELTIGFALFTIAPNPAFGFYLAILSSLTVAGLGMHLLLRMHSRTFFAPLFGGISYMMCGFITAWLFWPHVFTAIWIPWLLYAIGRYARSLNKSSFVGIVATTSIMFLGGFPFVVAIGLGAALVYAIFTSLEQGSRPAKTFLGATVGIATGLALVAVPMLALWAMVDGADLSHRHGGSALSLDSHAKLLLRPWAAEAPLVETNMYVGMTGLALCLIGLVRILKPANALVWAGVVYLIVGTTLVFGLLPTEIGARLPVLSNNPWHRAILLLDIGIIILAAAGLDFILGRMKRRHWIVLVGSVVCLVQALDLGIQFRRFNGPTPSRLFYDSSPEIELLRSKVPPFTYVAADSSHFMISGTLGAVGLADWYAHAMRSRALHNLLDAMAVDPFATPTSTMIGIERFKWSEQLADVVSLCYAIYPSFKNYPLVTGASGERTHPLPPIGRRVVTQPFEVADDVKVVTAAIRLATYRAKELDGSVTVTISDGKGATISQATMNAGEIHDNVMAVFEFSDKPALTAGAYTLTLRYIPGPSNKKLTAWIRDGEGQQVFLDGESLPGSIDFAIRGDGDQDDVWEVIAEGDQVSVAHNVGCANGIYRTEDLTNPIVASNNDKPRLLSYRPHRFTIATASPSAGYVVVPMQYQRGWKATIGNEEVPIQLVKGVLPAVAVPGGASRVEFSYQPPYWRLGVVISFLGVLLLFAAFRFLCTRDKT